VKVLTVPGKDRILGVTIVGTHAGDLLAEFVLAMKQGLGLNKILGTIHTYPTLSEANKYAAGEWKRAHQPHRLLEWVRKYHDWKRGLKPMSNTPSTRRAIKSIAASAVLTNLESLLRNQPGFGTPAMRPGMRCCASMCAGCPTTSSRGWITRGFAADRAALQKVLAEWSAVTPGAVRRSQPRPSRWPF
jgi:hypothetical protein